MTDSDDPSRRNLPPLDAPSAPTSPAEERPAPTLAELAQAEDPDDPPLASPDDVLTSPEDAPAFGASSARLLGQTAVEPALTVSTQVLEAGAPAEPTLSTRVPASRTGTDVVPRRRAASVAPRGEGAGEGGVSTSLAATSPLAQGTGSVSPSSVSAPSTSLAAAAVGASSSALGAAAPSSVLAPSSVRAPSTPLAPSSPLAPSTPLATRERAPSSASAPPPAAAPAFLPHVAPFSERPSQPPAPEAAGSVWTVVSSASSMTSPREVLSRGTGATVARPVRADEADTLGMGTPMPTLPFATAQLPASPLHTAPLQASPLPSASAPLPPVSLPAPFPASPLHTAPVQAAPLPAAVLHGAPAADAAATLPSNTTKVTAAQVVDARRLPDATTVRDASLGRDAPPPPPRDTRLTAAADPRARESDDTIGVGIPAPPRAASAVGGGAAGSSAGGGQRPPPPRNLGLQIFAWATVGMFGGMVLGGGCMACLGGGPGGDQLEGSGGPHVAVVELTGPIMDGGETVRELRRFARQGDIKAIVVRIDSPGGAVAPSQEIFDAMRAASDKKPVVVSMGTVAASGGFWAAMAGDWIVASPGSVTGSIGVISQTPDLRGLAELLRVDLKTYKSGPYKDSGNPLRAPQPGDEAVHMELISDVYDQFVTVISERRKIELDAVRRFADGRIFTGRRAHELGLVDQLGGLYDAAQHALVLVEERRAQAAGEAPEAIEDEPTLVYPRRPSGGLLRLLSEEAGEGAAAGAGRVLERALDVSARDPRVELR